MNERLGIPLGPDLDEIAKVLLRETGSRIVTLASVASQWSEHT
jgi:hypothetical protein